MANKNFEKHESGLVRRLGLGATFLLVISSMVGSGVFKKIAPMSSELGSAAWVLAAWVVAGLISWFGALTNAEVASQIAEPGGQYEYFKRIFGKPLAFFYGWAVFIVIQSATAAAVASVFAESFHSIFPFPEVTILEGVWTFGGASGLQLQPVFFIKLLALSVLWLITFINLRGVQHGERVSNFFTSIVILGIIGITGLCFGFGNGDWSHFASSSSSSTGSVGLSSFFLAMLAAFWAYEGWNNLGFLAGEIKNPSRNVPFGLALGVGFVMLMYVAINTAYLYILPIQDFVNIHEAKNAVSAVAVIQSFLGPVGSVIIASLIMIATFGTTNNTVMSAPRVYFAMARDGLFFSGAAKVHPKYEVPSKAILYQSIWATVLLLSGSFDQLTDMLIFAAFIFYGLGASAVFILRKRNTGQKPDFQVPGYPVIPAVFIAFCLVLVVNAIIEQPIQSGAGLLLIASGIPFYLYWSRKLADKETK